MDWPREKARVPAATRQALRSLRKCGAEVIIVSGRDVDGVMRVLRPRWMPSSAIMGPIFSKGPTGAAGCMATLAGSAGRPGSWRFGFVPGPTCGCRPNLYSIAVHWRGSTEFGKKVWDETADVLLGWGLDAHTGRRVIDVRLPGVNKGRAVLRWLKTREPGALRRGMVCYAGDDTTDEYAFEALEGRCHDHRGRQAARGAAYRTASPASLTRWLARLESVRQE